MTWILNEDNALKAWLSDLTVSDNKNPSRKVGVWFGQPDPEIRDQVFPYITIDLIDVREAVERQMRNRVTLTYTPDGAPAQVANEGYVTAYPIAYDLVYQVTTYARTPVHDRQIIAQLMANKLGGKLHTLYIPEDDTQRSMFLTGMAVRDRTDPSNKRLFSKAYTVTVCTELLPEDIALLPQVSTLNQTIDFTVDTLTIPTT